MTIGMSVRPIIVLALAVCVTYAESKQGMVETRLGTVPLNPTTSLASSNGRHYACVTTRNGKEIVILDGKPGPEFDKVWCSSVQFSPDGEVLGYLARRGKMDVAVIDGQAGPDFDAIWDDGFRLNRDGKRVAYLVVDKGDAYPIMDGKPDHRFRLSPDWVLWSPDGTSFSYRAETEAGADFIVTDGRAGPAFKALFADSFIYSGTGSRLAYGASVENGSVVVVDGKSGPVFDWLIKGSLTFSGSGKRFGYVGRRDKQRYAVIDGELQGPYDEVHRIVFSSDDKHVALVVDDGKEELVVADGKAQERWESVPVRQVHFDATGTLVYVGRRNSGSHLMVGGKVTRENDVIQIMPSPHRNRFACVVRTGTRWQVVIDGKAGLEYDGIAEGTPVFSDDEKRMAYLARKGTEWLAVVDGKEDSPSELIWADSFRFSPKAGGYAYVAGDGKQMWVVINGKSAPACDDVVNGPAYLPDGSLEYLALRGAELYRVSNSTSAK